LTTNGILPFPWLREDTRVSLFLSTPPRLEWGVAATQRSVSQSGEQWVQQGGVFLGSLLCFVPGRTTGRLGFNDYACRFVDKVGE
jgi:hypothetical protein